MAMSRRERTLAWGVGAVVGLLLLDSLVLTPYFKQRDALEELRNKAMADTESAYRTRNKELDLKEKWVQRRGQGLARDSEEAQKQLLGSIKDWAREAGLTIASVKPERIESKKELREIQLLASATGTNDALVKFMFKLQTAKFPVRLIEFQAGSRNDSPELAMQMRISTLYLTDEKKDGKNSTAPGNTTKPGNSSKKGTPAGVAAKREPAANSTATERSARKDEF